MKINNFIIFLNFILILNLTFNLETKEKTIKSINKEIETEIKPKDNNISQIKNEKKQNFFEKRFEMLKKSFKPKLLKEKFFITPLIDLKDIFVLSLKKSIVKHVEQKLGMNQNNVSIWKKWVFNNLKNNLIKKVDKLRLNELGIKENMEDIKDDNKIKNKLNNKNISVGQNEQNSTNNFPNLKLMDAAKNLLFKFISKKKEKINSLKDKVITSRSKVKDLFEKIKSKNDSFLSH